MGLGADEPDRHALLGSVKARRVLWHRIAEAEHSNHGGRVDVYTVGLVVEGDIAADDGNIECFTRCGHAFDRFDELPHDARLLRVSKVEVVDECIGSRARNRDIECRFVDDSR